MSAKPVLLHFKFDDFADFPSEVGVDFYSEPQTDCNGNKWVLELYPGGIETTDGYVSLYLVSENEVSMDIKFTFTVKDANKDIVTEWDCENEFITPDNLSWGRGNFMKRSDILDPSKSILIDGAFYIDVTIQVKDNKKHLFNVKCDIAKKMLNLLKSGERTDATFKVGEKTYRVHSPILHNNAPILANYIDNPDGKLNVKIEGVSTEVFEFILDFVYSGCCPGKKEILKFGKELIDAANKYELVELKMGVESVLVQQRILNKSNVSDYILFAESQSCPLLKEYAISYFLLHAKDILKSEHSKRLKESAELLSEIMMLMLEEEDGNRIMTVNELRKELGKRKLDVDGSKETLLYRLVEAKRQTTE